MLEHYLEGVLNLIINGLPSIPKIENEIPKIEAMTPVLNLIINGLPSIPHHPSSNLLDL